MAGTRTCTPDQVSFEGTVWVEAEVDLADALDLDTALSVGAARLADLGSTASLDVRRSESARSRWPATSSPWTSTPPTDTGTEHTGPRLRADGRWCCTCTSPRSHRRHPTRELHLARVANTRSFVDADQVRAWCGVPGAR